MNRPHGAEARLGCCPRRADARRVLAAAFTAFLLAQLGLSLAVETVKPAWRDPEFGLRLKRLRELRKDHPGQPLLIALGSSRTQMGLVPSEMHFPGQEPPPLVFNFGQAGAGPLLELLTLERLLRNGIKPDYLLVELFRPTLFAAEPDEREVPRVESRLAARDLPTLEPYCRSASGLWRGWASSRLVPWATYREELLGLWLPDWQPYLVRMHHTWEQIDSHGGQPFPFEATVGVFRSSWLQTFHDLYGKTVRNARVGPASLRTLRDLAALCQAQKIAMAFFLMPDGPMFQSLYSNGTRQRMDSRLQGLARELDVPLFDYTNGFAETEFADSHHLLRAGAVRFTRKFTEESVRPWIEKRVGSP